MQETGLSRARRAGISTLLLGITLLAGYLCCRIWPVTTYTIDPLRTPFYGPYQGNGFVHPAIHDTTGLRRAHKLILGATVLIALFGSWRWWNTHLIRQARRLARSLLAQRRRVRRAVEGSMLLLLFAFVVAKEIPSLRKIPDFSDRPVANMALINNHIGMTMGHADRLASGDMLFRDTTPVYGVLVPVLLASYERQFGLISLGDHIRWLVAVEILYWIIAGYLFLVWSRGRWLSCLLPVVLLLEYYWSTALGLIPPNHSPFRSAGLPLAAFCLVALRRASPRANQWAAGIVSALAVLANVESGIAATVGLVLYVYRRYALGGLNERPLGMIKPAARFAGGFIAALIGFAIVCRAGCGTWPYVPGLKHYFELARLSSSGYGTRPFRMDKFENLVVALWPLAQVGLAIWSVSYAALERPGGFRPSFRIAVGTMLLVWFAYFVNRPEPGYLASYNLLYGLLLIDCGRYLGQAIKRPRRLLGIRAALAIFVLGYSGFMASRVIEWSWNPSQWTVKCWRWGVPLVDRGPERAPGKPRISGAYLPKPYADSLRDRSTHLRRMARGERLVYFTVDSYLMPRLSGVLPLQQYPDPSEAFTRPSYDRLLSFVVKAPVSEVYVDSRIAANLVWYGGVFDLLRRDLSRRFECTSIEHGWEIWRRRSQTALEHSARSGGIRGIVGSLEIDKRSW
jgi:hypothetical protein